MIAELERCFEPAPLPTWFHAFEVDPQKAIGDLLFGRFYLDSRNTDEPEDLLIDWANFTSRQSGFLELLDEALEQWINDNWGKFPEVSAGRLAVAWCRVADVVAFVEHLENAAAALLIHFEERDEYLGALSDGPSRDSLGRYLFAIARYQKDRGLAPFWRELCNLNAGTPFYHGRYAIAGVRGLPEQDSERGGFRNDVALALLKLGRALDRLVTEDVVTRTTADEFFVGVGWHTVAAYPFRSRWRQVFAPAVNTASKRLSGWLRKVLPDVETSVRETGNDATRVARFDHTWPVRARQLSKQLATNPESALPEAENLIAEQRAFTESSGDADGLTKTLCGLSRAIRGHDPVRSAQWAEEATNWSPWNPHTWTHWTKALEIAGRVPEALVAAWHALERFPQDPFVATDLTHLLIAAGRLQEAEQIAWEGVEWFPRDNGCWHVLAAVLRANQKYSQAERVWRELLERSGLDGQGWASLAQVLVLQDKLHEAESELRQAVDKFPGHRFLWNSLGVVLIKEGNLAESERVLREAANLFGYPDTKTSLALSIRIQGRPQEALDLVEQVLKDDPADRYALAEKAKILQDMGQLEEAFRIFESVRLSHPTFRVDEQDLLADFLKEDTDREREGPELHPLAPEFEEPPSFPPTQESWALQEEPSIESKRDLSNRIQTPGLSGREVYSSHKPTAPVRQDSTLLRAQERRRVLAKPSLTKLQAWKLSATISEARLLRRWAHRNQISNELPPPLELLQKSARLLEGLLSRAPHHPRACLEKAYLLIESGSLNEARQFLEEQIAVIPNPLGLRQALGRVNRELARQQNLRFDEEQYATLTKPLLELQQKNYTFRPLTYLGRGRVCFAMHDGQPLRHAASQDFQKLRKYTSQRPEIGDDFRAWWSGQIDALIFADVDPHSALSSENIGPVERALAVNRYRLDRLEEDFTYRMSC